MAKLRLLAYVVMVAAFAHTVDGAVSTKKATVDGLTWTYYVSKSVAVIGGDAGPAVPAQTTGRIEIPRYLGGYPVEKVGRGAFVFGKANASEETVLVFPDTIKEISSFACSDAGTEPAGVAPYFVRYFRPMSDFGVSAIFAGAVPTVVDDSMNGTTFYRYRLSSDNNRVSLHSMFYGTTVRYAKGAKNWKNYVDLNFEEGRVLEDCDVVKFSPSSGTEFEDSMTVSLSCSSSGAQIYYTTDGSRPEEPGVSTNENGTVVVQGLDTLTYNGPFEITDTCQVRAIAVVEGYSSVLETSASYKCVRKTVTTPVIKPSSCSFYTSSLKVMISCDFDGADIYYTVDGTKPTTNSVKYTGPFYVGSGLLQGQSVTVRAIAWKENNNVSGETSAKYTRSVSTAEALGLSDPTTGYMDAGIEIHEDLMSSSWEIRPDSGSDTSYMVACSDVFAGDMAQMTFLITEPGSLTFDWQLLCETYFGDPGPSFAVCMVEGERFALLKSDAGSCSNVKASDSGEGWSTLETPIVVTENDFDDSGCVVVRISFTGKNFQYDLDKDELRLRNFVWTPEIE